MLLLLEQECVAGNGDATSRLAVGMIRPGDGLVVREVGPIILSLAASVHSRDLGNDVGRTLIGALHVAHTRGAPLTSNLSSNGRSRGLERMLERVVLV